MTFNVWCRAFRLSSGELAQTWANIRALATCVARPPRFFQEFQMLDVLDKDRVEPGPQRTGKPGRAKARVKARRRPLTPIVLLVVLAAAALGGWWYWQQAGSTAAGAPPTTAVTRGDIQQTVLATGSLQANSVVSVGAQVSGPIQKLYVKVGDVVKAGDAIAQIDSTQQQNAVRSSQAALASAEAQLAEQQATLEQTQAALDRAKGLAKQSFMSKADLQTAEANYDVAKAKIEQTKASIDQAQIAVDTAQHNLAETRIVAPSAGTIVAVLVSQGQQVSAQQSSPTIVKIADLDTMVIDAQISEADVTKVRPGQQVYFTVLGDPDNKISATLRSINPAPQAIETEDTGIASDSTAIYYDGLFDVPNPDHKLRIAMTANVTIVLRDEPNALLVPASAVHAGRDGNAFVAVYDPATQQITRQRVTVGIDNNVMASIESGLEEGQLVVTSGRGAETGATSGQSDSRNGRGAGRFGRRAPFGL
jgi:macrolide-specific efflux system membrane fusion protein